jgi:hypothetical protein
VPHPSLFPSRSRRSFFRLSAFPAEDAIPAKVALRVLILGGSVAQWIAHWTSSDESTYSSRKYTMSVSGLAFQSPGVVLLNRRSRTLLNTAADSNTSLESPFQSMELP